MCQDVHDEVVREFQYLEFLREYYGYMISAAQPQKK